MGAIVAAALAAFAVPADAAQTTKKSIWGPVEVNGRSVFPTYAELGVRIYQTKLDWSVVAERRPAAPRDPNDPAYRWTPDVDAAVREAGQHGIRVAIQLISTPRWANGNRDRRWAPSRRQHFADFATAAARRYPGVRLWMIWGEPSRRGTFLPLARERRGRPLSRRATRGPRIYARMLDASYAALKRENRRNIVIGGNTWTAGDISPLNYIRAMKLPGGRPPRLDLYGHNPLSNRRPDLRRSQLAPGLADFSDLDDLARWVDRYLGRPRGKRRMKLFLSEFTIPTDHPNRETNFWVTRAVQASWIRSALRITRGWWRIYTVGWFTLYDEEPRPAGDEVNRGLLDYRGGRKPSFFAFRDG
jgi:hypothetical protein